MGVYIYTVYAPVFIGFSFSSTTKICMCKLASSFFSFFLILLLEDVLEEKIREPTQKARNTYINIHPFCSYLSSS